ncbi:hypothetical protein SRIMM317S_02776 [Streptomyces rimosus subsp. rimosus]
MRCSPTNCSAATRTAPTTSTASTWTVRRTANPTWRTAEAETVTAGDTPVVPHGPLGDPDLLADLGIGGKELLALDTDALSEIADALGCTDVLEAVR